MSERISWVTCPECGASAAVGWDGDRPVEFDCMAGCRLSPSHLQQHFGDAGVRHLSLQRPAPEH